MRWYLHNVVGRCISKKQWSKNEWDRIVKDGRVSVNGLVAKDSARILQTGWNVTVLLGENTSTNTLVQHIPIIDTWNTNKAEVSTDSCDANVFVVWKPVGLRTIGSFDASTLEEIFSKQQWNASGVVTKFQSLSKLDKGCSGLCILRAVQQQRPDSNIQLCDLTVITHTFTALVHGHVPEEWKLGVTIHLPMDGVRRWKNRAVECSTDEQSSTTEQCRVRLFCVEQTHEIVSNIQNMHTIPALSTIAIATESRSSKLAQVIAYYLRKSAGHPIVGDRIAVQEYLSLPRSMRNRIKQRFCFGCTAVKLQTIDKNDDQSHETLNPIPDRWSADYWQNFSIKPATHLLEADRTSAELKKNG